MLNVYCTQHRWSKMVCTAFAAGAKCPIVPPAPLLPGDVMMYGALRGLLPTLRQAQREGRTWIFGDNGYFRPGKSETSYFRLTKNALQHSGTGELPFPKHLARARWQRHGIQIAPWRSNGAHIIICPPGRLFGATFGFDSEEWLRTTLKTLGRHTKRELRVRNKMSWNDVKPVLTQSQRPLADDLHGAWALVTYCSNSAVEAICAGIPVFCTNPCAASAMGLSDLTQIEHPRTDGDRKHWAALLSCNQWLLSEMRSGLAWKMINESAF